MNLLKIKQFIEDKKLPSYRYKQILEAYFSGKYKSFFEITNISVDLRNELNNLFKYHSVEVNEVKEYKSSIKLKLKLIDGNFIETVLMKYSKWNTICVSTQVGCAMGCVFCATGKMGIKRNLTIEEIVDQILIWKNRNIEVNRIVFMGMGEPFLNYENVIDAINIIHDYLNIGSRKMSISTVGVIDGINKLAKSGKEINLAISLHSLNQKIREKIMPSTKKYKLDNIINAVENYINLTNRQVFFEYVLMDKINDSNEDAYKLAKFIRSNKLFFLNILKLNKVKNSFVSPSKKFREFCKILDEQKVKYSFRLSMGDEIEAACGQLITSSE